MVLFIFHSTTVLIKQFKLIDSQGKFIQVPYFMLKAVTHPPSKFHETHIDLYIIYLAIEVNFHII